MTVLKVIYVATTLILWLCIILNAACILRSKKLMKYYDAAIKAARAAEENYLKAADNYHFICKKMQEESAQ